MIVFRSYTLFWIFVSTIEKYKRKIILILVAIRIDNQSCKFCDLILTQGNCMGKEATC